MTACELIIYESRAHGPLPVPHIERWLLEQMAGATPANVKEIVKLGVETCLAKGWMTLDTPEPDGTVWVDVTQAGIDYLAFMESSSKPPGA